MQLLRIIANSNNNNTSNYYSKCNDMFSIKFRFKQICSWSLGNI